MIVRKDALAHASTFDYDALGHLISETDALGQVTRHIYDELGRRISQTDANGHTTRFAYDKRGREIARSLPDGATETKAYDAAGQLQTHVDFKGRTTAYAYDSKGREFSRTYPDGRTVTFGYTPNDLLNSEVDARGTTTYAYDSRNRRVLTTYPDGNALSIGYDAAGARTALTATVGSQTWTMLTAYDVVGRPSEIVDPLGRSYTFKYDAVGNRTELDDPNATATKYVYDARNRLASLATVRQVGGVAATIQSYSYALDAASRKTTVVEADGAMREFSYDDINRLTRESVVGVPNGSPSYTKAFVYDSVGNRLTQVTTGSGAGTVGYSYDSRDRLTNENAIGYIYDTNGNLTSKSGEGTYTWDFENRLTRISVNENIVVDHVYDAKGHLMMTTVARGVGSSPSTVVKFLVDTSSPLSQVFAETDENNALKTLYVRLGDELLSVVRPSVAGYTTKYVHHDGLGSVRALTDENGVTTDVRGYEGFGTMNVSIGSDVLSDGFAGEPLQNESKLAYHRARWMDSRVGRFLGMDPRDATVSTRSALEDHLFIYANDNPVNETDPSGLFSGDVNTTISVVPMSQMLSLTSVASAVGKTVALACALEAAVSTVSPDSSKSPCQYFRVRLQAQGPRTLKDGYVKVGPRILEASVVLGPRPTVPFSVAEGWAGLDELKLKLATSELSDRADQFKKAANFIDRGPPLGIGPPGKSFGHRLNSAVRVDVEIQEGINFQR